MINWIGRTYYYLCLFTIVWLSGGDFQYFLEEGRFLPCMSVIASWLILAFVFQVDIFGLNLIGTVFKKERLFALMARQRYRRKLEKESDLLINQIDGSNLIARITDRRLIVKGVLAWPGIAFYAGDIGEVERAEIGPRGPALYGTRMALYVSKPDGLKVFRFRTRKPHLWRFTLEKLKIPVE